MWLWHPPSPRPPKGKKRLNKEEISRRIGGVGNPPSRVQFRVQWVSYGHEKRPHLTGDVHQAWLHWIQWKHCHCCSKARLAESSCTAAGFDGRHLVCLAWGRIADPKGVFPSIAVFARRTFLLIWWAQPWLSDCRSQLAACFSAKIMAL